MEMPGDGSGFTTAQRAALQSVAALLNQAEITWAITGSMAFALRGLAVVHHDLDIQTDAAGA